MQSFTTSENNIIHITLVKDYMTWHKDRSAKASHLILHIKRSVCEIQRIEHSVNQSIVLFSTGMHTNM